MLKETAKDDSKLCLVGEQREGRDREGIGDRNRTIV